ncbi:NAD+ diphosphatase [Angomonas deanei]|nr:NAD+ diphosphatase [Angomonas deanei]EPY38633.1 NAD+ diphosphatase [Angomonas deanei]|eukprot:EPY38421.1 NAD+ diphosphatase [Angomonas deanei]
MSCVQWLASIPFCAKCGAPTSVNDWGMRRTCTACKQVYYPVISPAMIVAVLDGKGSVLLSQRRQQFGPATDRPMRTILAGFVAQGESLEETVVREVEEESAARVTSLRYVGSQPWPYPSQLMVCFYAVAGGGHTLVAQESELVNVAWVKKEEVRKALNGEHEEFIIPPPFTAAHTLLSAWASGEVNDLGE